MKDGPAANYSSEVNTLETSTVSLRACTAVGGFHQHMLKNKIE